MAVGFPTKANWAAGDVLTASALDDLAGTVNTVQYLKPWNQVLNSNFSVWQRGTSISMSASTGTTYAADRWASSTGANQAITISRQSTNDTTNLPNIQYCARYQRNSGQTGTGNLVFAQSFETVNSIPFSGKQVTFSFYARAGANYSAASNILSVYVVNGTGTDQSIFAGFTGSNNVILANATLTTTWQRFNYTATVPATATQLATYFLFAPTGTAGVNDYFEITGVQLEQGSVANTYQPNQATYEAELAADQRYYPKYTSTTSTDNYGTMSGFGLATTTTNITATIQFPVTTRIPPTSIDYSNLSVYGMVSGTANFLSVSAATLTRSTNSYAEVALTVSGATAGGLYRIQANNTAGYIGFGAEL